MVGLFGTGFIVKETSFKSETQPELFIAFTQNLFFPIGKLDVSKLILFLDTFGLVQGNVPLEFL